MKTCFSTALFLSFALSGFGQVQIHSHNDYLQQDPFTTAYLNKVDEMEADVFLIRDTLFVAHSRKAIQSDRTLDALYLRPISESFKKHKPNVSADKNYTFSLMIDVKENWGLVYPVLKREIEQYGGIFDRSKHKWAIRIVISGERPSPATFENYPSWLFFDGLPNLGYSKGALKRISMISDNFGTYSKWKGKGDIAAADKYKLKEIIDAAHLMGKPVRFWGAPDTPAAWLQLHALGAEIINTDKINECSTYFQNYK